MKKLLLLIGIVLLFSCEKEMECKTCTTYVWFDLPHYHAAGNNSTQIACGKELKQLDHSVRIEVFGDGTVSFNTLCK